MTAARPANGSGTASAAPADSPLFVAPTEKLQLDTVAATAPTVAASGALICTCVVASLWTTVPGMILLP